MTVEKHHQNTSFFKGIMAISRNALIKITDHYFPLIMRGHIAAAGTN
jgi:hypothetical protein